MPDFEISGWVPSWAPARATLADQRADLHALAGRRIIDSWLVWDTDHDGWFADLPVVLLLDNGRQLEASWQNWGELSITWNTIDVTTTPIGSVTWPPLAWRSQAHPSLHTVTGEVITEAASTEHLFTTRQIYPPSTDAGLSAVWLASGLWLRTAASGLHIFNALDENGLSNKTPIAGDDLRVLEI